jgi:hypothetical protein
MVRLTPLWWFLLLTAAIGLVPLHAQKLKPTPQGSIYAETDERFEHSTALPNAVLRLILHTPEAKGAMDLANDSERRRIAEYFRTTEVRLSDSGEVDLLVRGSPPMRGANVGWFWFVRSPNNNPKIVLFAIGDSVELLRSKRQGLKDVRSVHTSPVYTHICIYRFSGNIYRLSKETWDKDAH